MQHHANLPLAGLLHDQPVGDVTHFTGSRADALCDFLTHALFVVQSTVYRAARYTAAVCNLLHRYHKITLLRYLYLYYITYLARAPDVTCARK